MLLKEQLDELLSDVVKAAKTVFGDKLNDVILFGSYARGDFDDESDVDIMIIADIGNSGTYGYSGKLHELLSKTEIENACVFSFCITDTKKFRELSSILPFYKNVLKDGVHFAA